MDKNSLILLVYKVNFHTSELIGSGGWKSVKKWNEKENRMKMVEKKEYQ